MNSNDNFLTFEEFQNRFEIKANYLHYFQLIAAIPPDLKRKAFGPHGSWTARSNFRVLSDGR